MSPPRERPPLIFVLAIAAVLVAVGYSTGSPPSVAWAQAPGVPGLRTTAVTVAAASDAGAQPCPATSFNGRRQITFYNEDTTTVWLGPNPQTASDGGYPLPPAGSLTLPIGYQTSPSAGQVYCWSSTGTDAGAVRTVEIR